MMRYHISPAAWPHNPCLPCDLSCNDECTDTTCEDQHIYLLTEEEMSQRPTEPSPQNNG